MSEALTVEQYQAKVLSAITPAAAVSLPLLQALGLCCAEDVRAAVALPGFDNSAMDGYAVRHEDVAAAPVRLRVCGEIGAGAGRVAALVPGTATKIMTGAALPSGADSVVPYESTDRGDSEVLINDATAAGQNVRYAGEDVAVGDLVVESGTSLGPRHLALLAAVGRERVLVRPRPRVAVIATGSELRAPGEALEHGTIYNSNSYLLAACVQHAGGAPVFVDTAGDTSEQFAAVLHQRLPEVDLVITSGGVSMGDFDVVKQTLAPGGAWFGTVAIQPGKPQGFTVLDGVPVIALPGNPVAVFVSFVLFAAPLLRRLMGLTPEIEPPRQAVLATATTVKPGKRQYLRGTLADGVATPLTGQGSHMLGKLVDATCLIVIDSDAAHAAQIPAGATVPVLPL